MSFQLDIRLDHTEHGYRPGEPIIGRAIITSIERWQVDYAEVALVWHTEGRGDENRESVAKIAILKKDDSAPAQIDHRFTINAPRFPWSYHGINIKIHWSIGLYIKAKGEGEAVFERTIIIHPNPDRLMASR